MLAVMVPWGAGGGAIGGGWVAEFGGDIGGAM